MVFVETPFTALFQARDKIILQLKVEKEPELVEEVLEDELRVNANLAFFGQLNHQHLVFFVRKEAPLVVDVACIYEVADLQQKLLVQWLIAIEIPDQREELAHFFLMFVGLH